MPTAPPVFPPDSALAALAPGLVLGDRFALVSLAGRGGMGVVWRATDRVLEQEVALKFIPSVVACDSDSTNELRREARRARDLAHPHICRVHDYGQDLARGLAWISMEYLPGDNLARCLQTQKSGFFEIDKVLPWALQLCDALSYAHERANLVHRDVKPSNLLLDAADAVKVSDFGIAQTLSDSFTRLTGTSMTPTGSTGSGTPLYMSPQQARGERPRATDDLYALGATLFELLTGRPPFFAGDLNWQRQHVPPPSVAARRVELHQCDAPVPEHWEITLRRLLAKYPEHRPQSAREVADALRTAPSPAEIKTGPAPQTELVKSAALATTVIAPAAPAPAPVPVVPPKTSPAPSPGPRPTAFPIPAWLLLVLAFFGLMLLGFLLGSWLGR
jgi:serine/threonine protein kinase